MAKVGNVAGQGGSIGTSPPSAMSSLREGPPHTKSTFSTCQDAEKKPRLFVRRRRDATGYRTA